MSQFGQLKAITGTFHALWTVCEVSLFDSDETKMTTLLTQGVQCIEAFEQECSRFLGNSKLSELNRNGHAEVSSQFLRILEISLALFDGTNGFFDPLCDIRTAGYTLSFDAGIFESRKQEQKYNMRQIRIVGNMVTLPDGAYLDFGAIGKGFIAGELSEFLRQSGCINHIINLGWDIVASGKNAEWHTPRVAIASPFSKDPLGSVLLNNEAIATSGSYLRKWNTQLGDMHHHLKNPYDDTHEMRIVSLSVIHSQAAIADWLATALFVMGEEQALLYAKEHSLDCMIVLSDGGIRMTSGFAEKYHFVLHDE